MKISSFFLLPSFFFFPPFTAGKNVYRRKQKQIQNQEGLLGNKVKSKKQNHIETVSLSVLPFPVKSCKGRERSSRGHPNRSERGIEKRPVDGQDGVKEVNEDVQVDRLPLLPQALELHGALLLIPIGNFFFCQL